MARNCNCSGSTCGCQIIAGNGIGITGIGTAASPFQITNTGASLSDSFSVANTTTLGLVLLGSGTNEDPFILSGNVTLKLQQLSDVSNPSGVPVAGQSPVYVGTSGGDGHWEFHRPFQPLATGSRPTAASAGAGGTYYDTTLQKPAWSDGATWRDAMGTAV
jgi:hypothetical protein